MHKIMFNDEFGLTKAVLEGRKTMTRRIIPGIIQGSVVITDVYNGSITHFAYNEESASRGDGSAVWTKLVPKYKVGEVVAVAQAYEDVLDEMSCNGTDSLENARPILAHSEDGGWDNKMFVRAELMPHQIRITDIHVERLQDISDEDCFREGVDVAFQNGHAVSYYRFENSRGHYYTPREAFAALIDKVSGKGTWDSNPWVFVYEFVLI